MESQRKRRLRSTAVGAFVAAAALSFLSAAPANAVAPDLQYVALGDSYASGFGLVTPLTGTPVPGCAQNSADYPRVTAAALGIQVTDVTCAGASSQNILQPQTTPSGVAPAQADALSPETDVVTITIGGNDAGFFQNVVAACLAAGPDGPLLLNPGATSCQASTEPLVQASLASIAVNVRAAYEAVRAAAPNAEILVVGYPALVPDAANTPANGCFRPALDPSTTPPTPIPNSFPFTTVDVPFLNDVQQRLNTTLQAAALASEFTFISNLESTLAGSACAPESDQLVRGITLVPNPANPVGFDTTPDSLHPTANGISRISAAVVGAITAAFPDQQPPAPSGAAPIQLADAGPVQRTLPATGYELANPLMLSGVAATLIGGLLVVHSRSVGARRSTSR